MAAIPPAVVAGCFLAAVLTALAIMVYIAWRGSKPSSFFTDAVADRYDLELPEHEINTFYDLKERLQEQVGVQAPVEGAEAGPPWAHQLPQEDRGALMEALMNRLKAAIERLDQVQRDKPGNWKLWRGKLVSEDFWNSLLDAERLIGQEIDDCLAESDDVQPGWREHIFQQAVQLWRMDKHALQEKKEQKKAVLDEKKGRKHEEKMKVVEVKQQEEDRKKQERLAEKAMEKLLREEELSSKSKKKGQEKASAKPKAKKK